MGCAKSVVAVQIRAKVIIITLIKLCDVLCKIIMTRSYLKPTDQEYNYSLKSLTCLLIVMLDFYCRVYDDVHTYIALRFLKFEGLLHKHAF